MKCKLCNKEIEQNYFRETLDKMNSKQLCFKCNYWDEMLENDKQFPEKSFVIDGVHYIIGGENEREKGFDGERFLILLNNGKRIETTNLWCQGKIPEIWKDKFPDNATFVIAESKDHLSGSEIHKLLNQVDVEVSRVK